MLRRPHPVGMSGTCSRNPTGRASEKAHYVERNGLLQRKGGSAKLGNRLNKPGTWCYNGSMITSIKFPPATLSRLQAEAEKSGKDLDTLVTEAVEAKMALAHLSLHDVLRPINEEIAASGLAPEEAEAFFEQELSAMRAERKSSAGKQ